MTDVDELAGALTRLVTSVARRGARWATRVAVVVFVAGLVMYLLGLAALGGSVGRVWPWLGAVIVLAAVAAPLLARWRLTSVSKDATGLVAEVRTLVSGSADAHRVVVDTVETADRVGAEPAATLRGVEVHEFRDLRRLAGTAQDLRRLPLALAAVTTFPGLLAIGILATMAFGFVSLIFLLALAF